MRVLLWFAVLAATAPAARGEVTVISAGQGLSGIGAGSGGSVWAAGSHSGNQSGPKPIIHFAATGQELGRFTVFDGIQDVPGDVLQLSGGDLVVGGTGADGTGRIGRYSPIGTPGWEVGGYGWRLAFASGEVLAAETNARRIVRRDPANGNSPGTIVWSAGNPAPYGITGLADGSILAADLVTGEPPRRYTVTGQLLGTLSTAGFGYGGSVERTAANDEVYAATESSAIIRRVGLDNTLRGMFDSGPWLNSVYGIYDLALSGDILWVLGQENSGIPVSKLLAIDTQTPIASISAPVSPVETGQELTFDASGSVVPFSAVTRFEWDLDGDGAFESDTGQSSVAKMTYPTRGVRQVTVRATGPNGRTDLATANVDVRQAPLPGPRGATINEGARFTNDPRVTVTLRWPRFATDFVLSNDGGFANALGGPVNPGIEWSLDSSGPERLPKTIYVRFIGGEAGPETYQDDIILDETRPRVLSATVSGGGGARQGTASRRVRLFLRIRARDNVSGVARMQITQQRRRPGKARRFRKRASLRGRARRPVYVRVHDYAGNWSRWRSAARPRRRH